MSLLNSLLRKNPNSEEEKTFSQDASPASPHTWLCPHCGNPVEIEGVGPSRDGTYQLTFWNCEPCQVWAVTPSDLREPPTGWVSKAEQWDESARLGHHPRRARKESTEVNSSSGGKRVWATDTKVGVEEVALKLIVARFFVSCPTWHGWLVYDKKTGQGAGLIVGPMRPKRKALKRHTMPFGIAEVDPKFQPLLLEYGPESLRWDGKKLIARGN
jgi:hypothetical protein